MTSNPNSTSLQNVARYVAHQLKLHADKLTMSGVELEATIGVVDANGRFTAGIPFEYFFNVVYALNTARGLKWGDKKHETMMSVYDCNNTRTRFYQNTRVPDVIVKKKLWDVVVICEGHPFDIRITHSLEEPTVAPLALQTAVHHRIQERWTYHYDTNTTYDLTKVSSGRSKDIARQGVAKYEIEVEMVPPDRISLVDAFCLTFVNRSLDLLGRYDRSQLLDIDMIIRP